jgi:hypothetical protein
MESAGRNDMGDSMEIENQNRVAAQNIKLR